MCDEEIGSNFNNGSNHLKDKDTKSTSSASAIDVDNISIKTSKILKEIANTSNKIIDTRSKISESEVYTSQNRLLGLVHELASINKDLIISLKNLDKKYEQQREFINIAAHEIRSPCHAIIGYVELLNLGSEDDTKYLASITRNAERLSLLISNILDASRIDNKTLSLKKVVFDLIKLIDQIIEDKINEFAKEKRENITITREISNSSYNNKNEFIDTSKIKQENDSSEIMIFVNADKARITQVIFNLLDNAINFTTKGNIVFTIEENNDSSNKNRIDNSINKHEKRETVIRIKDPGVGIDPKILPGIFSKFTSDFTTGGTGLGLFIAKSIVEAHGGKIWAQNNEDGNGATVSFSLPLDMN